MMETTRCLVVAVVGAGAVMVGPSGAIAGPIAGMSRSPIKQVNYPVFSDALYLDVPSEKSTIQDAVDAVDGPLPIIRLAAGEYEENIEIEREK